MNINYYEEFKRLRHHGNFWNCQQYYYLDIDRLRVLSHSGNMRQNTSSLNSKQIQRRENKKRKMSALYMISSLNEEDRNKAILKSAVAKIGCEDPNKTEVEMKKESKKRKFEEVDCDNIKGKPELVKQQLSDDELQKLRILIRKRFAAKKNLPKLILKEPGLQASIDHPKEKRIPLFLSDVQHFILHSLHGHMSTGNIPRWARIEKFPNLKHVLFLVVEGMSLTDYNKYESFCPTLKEFQHKLEVITPLAYGGCLIREMATLPLTESQRHKLEKKFSSMAEASNSNRISKVLRTMFPIGFLKKSHSDQINDNETRRNAFSRTELLLSPWQMLEESYPLLVEGELKAKYANYVFTKDTYKDVSDNSPMWALDCEMCLTAAGSELTRVSVINENLEVVYESLVKPYNPIVNYLTRFSGITPKLLENVWTRLEEVQNTLRQILPSDVILIGHSLNMDLHALKMLHPYCIDTSVVFNLSGERTRKTKLKVLSAGFLGERIQNGQSGHDSVEDAAACMKLIQAKLEQSIEWGDAVISGPETVQQILTNENRIAQKNASTLQVKRSCNVPKQSTVSQSITDQKQTAQTSGIKSSKGGGTLPKCIQGDNVMQVQMFTTSLFSHLILRDKKCLLVSRSSVLNEFVKYIPDYLRPFHAESRVQISKQEANKAVVKYGRNNVPETGAAIMYTVVERKPQLTAIKVDNLVKKLTKDLSGNVLVAVLLAGRTTAFDEVDTSNHGLLFLQLHQESIAPIQLDRDTCRSSV